MLLSVAFQQLYSIADSIIVGKFVGESALAAVSASYPLTMIFIAVSTGFSTGAGVVISRFFGANEPVKVKSAASTSILFALILSVMLTVIGLPTSAPVLRLLDTHADIFADSVLYLNIYCLGLIFLFVYNIANGIFTAMGDSRTPLYLLIFSSLLNIALDLCFVIALSLGVGGAAWATLISQGVSAVCAIVLLCRRLCAMAAKVSYSRFSPAMLGSILRLAVPSILQMSFISVGNLFIQARVNHFGVFVTAGYGAAIKLNTFAVTCFTTVSNAISSFTAQNMGRGLVDRVSEGLKAGIKIMFTVASPFIVAFTAFGRPLMGLFARGEGAEIIHIGHIMLLIIAPFYFFVGAKIVCDGILRGSGAVYAFTTATLIDLVLRVILCYVFSAFWAEVGIWLAWPVGWVISCGVSFAFYKAGKWKNMEV